MHTYRFTFQVDGDISDEQIEQLFEAGCDDGSPHSCNGKWQIDFDRDAESLGSAVSSARQQVQSCGVNVTALTIEGKELASLPST